MFLKCSEASWQVVSFCQDDGECDLFVVLFLVSRILVRLHHCSKAVTQMTVSSRSISAPCTLATKADVLQKFIQLKIIVPFD